MLAYDDEGAYVCGPPEAAGAHAWLMLGQSHLFFDIQGRFLGLRWDDMGDWEPRQPVEEPHA